MFNNKTKIKAIAPPPPLAWLVTGPFREHDPNTCSAFLEHKRLAYLMLGQHKVDPGEHMRFYTEQVQLETDCEGEGIACSSYKGIYLFFKCVGSNALYGEIQITIQILIRCTTENSHCYFEILYF